MEKNDTGAGARKDGVRNENGDKKKREKNEIRSNWVQHSLINAQFFWTFDPLLLIPDTVPFMKTDSQPVLYLNDNVCNAKPETIPAWYFFSIASFTESSTLEIYLSIPKFCRLESRNFSSPLSRLEQRTIGNKEGMEMCKRVNKLMKKNRMLPSLRLLTDVSMYSDR